MHELSIAMSMIEMATDELKRHDGTKVNALHLKLGGLSGVVKEALLFSWEIACQGTPLENSSLEIEDVPIVFYCTNCEEQKTPDSVNSFFCPSCHFPASEILQGKELEVTALEII